MFDVSVIGLGAAARAGCLPTVRALDRTRLRCVVGADGQAADRVRRRYGADGVERHHRAVRESTDVARVGQATQSSTEVIVDFLRQAVPVFAEGPIASAGERAWTRCAGVEGRHTFRRVAAAPGGPRSRAPRPAVRPGGGGTTGARVDAIRGTGGSGNGIRGAAGGRHRLLWGHGERRPPCDRSPDLARGRGTQPRGVPGRFPRRPGGQCRGILDAHGVGYRRVVEASNDRSRRIRSTLRGSPANSKPSLGGGPIHPRQAGDDATTLCMEPCEDFRGYGTWWASQFGRFVVAIHGVEPGMSRPARPYRLLISSRRVMQTELPAGVGALPRAADRRGVPRVR